MTSTENRNVRSGGRHALTANARHGRVISRSFASFADPLWNLGLIWNLELGTWSLELGAWNLELGTWNLELGTWNLELGTWNFPPALCLLQRYSALFSVVQR